MDTTIFEKCQGYGGRLEEEEERTRKKRDGRISLTPRWTCRYSWKRRASPPLEFSRGGFARASGPKPALIKRSAVGGKNSSTPEAEFLGRPCTTTTVSIELCALGGKKA